MIQNALRTARWEADPLPAAPCLSCIVVVAAATFNACLAIVNGHITAVSSREVILAEGIIVLAAHAIALVRYREEMLVWYVLLALTASFAVVRVLLSGEMDPKYFRDVALIPTFVVLGMATGERPLDRLFITLHAIVVVVFVIEMADNDLYQAIFKIKDYYLNTRGASVEDFWNPESELFVSATRPNERFIDILDAPRASSIFLEPVSLGNYCILATAYLVTRGRRIGKAARALFWLSIVALLIGSDGRLAVVTVILVVIVSTVVPLVQPRAAILYLPAAVLTAAAAVKLGGFQAGEDDFPGRLAHSIELLAAYDFYDWLGLSSKHISAAMDSGLAYLIMSQSIFGLVLLWMFITWCAHPKRAEQVVFTHAIALFLSLTMLVSYSMVTIKTAAPMWFVFGCLLAPGSALPSGRARSTVCQGAA